MVFFVKSEFMKAPAAACKAVCHARTPKLAEDNVKDLADNIPVKGPGAEAVKGNYTGRAFPTY